MTKPKGSKTKIPPDTFNRELFEDRYWAEAGRKALAEFRASGRKAIPWEKVKQRLGL